MGCTDTHSFNFLIATHSSCSVLICLICVFTEIHKKILSKNQKSDCYSTPINWTYQTTAEKEKQNLKMRWAISTDTKSVFHFFIDNTNEISNDQ